MKLEKKMSINNNKSVQVLATYSNTGDIYRTFVSIADAAEHFFNDRNRRAPIKYALEKKTLFLNKYYLSRALL